MQQAKANYPKCISIAQMHMYKDNYAKGTRKNQTRELTDIEACIQPCKLQTRTQRLKYITMHITTQRVHAKANK